MHILVLGAAGMVGRKLCERLLRDGRLGKSGCILESEIGVIDASLDGKIAALKKSFERIFGERRQS